MLLNKHAYSVANCSLQEARALVAEHHYARGSSKVCCFSHGLYSGGLLRGVALWLPPTRVCAESVLKDRWQRVLSLSRLVVVPGEPTNAASFLVGRSIRLIKQSGLWDALVTFADESQGHTGGIYRATNWTYVGRTGPYTRWIDSAGVQRSLKATRSRSVSEMEALGYKKDGRHFKHKFVMVLR